MSNVQIKGVDESYLEELVALHRDAFQNFFLTTLGERFLKVYYRATLLDERGVLIGAFEDEKLIAFASGTLSSQGYHKSLFFKNAFSFSFSLCLAFIKRPTVLKRLYKNLEKSESSLGDKDYAELLSIAVSPKRQGSGLSSSILEVFEEHIKSEGQQKLSLTTDEFNNDRAISFYKKNGYKLLYSFKAYPDRSMLRMIKKLKKC